LPLIRNLGLTRRPLFFWGKRPRYSMNMGTVGPQQQAWTQCFLPLPILEPPSPLCWACSLCCPG